MKCMHCQGEMERGASSFHIDRKGVHLSLDNVRAWVCRQCGEPYFEAAEVDSIQAMIEAIDAQATKLVPIA